MNIVPVEKPIIILTGNRLYNQVSRCYKKPVKIIMTEKPDALFQILTENIGALLLLDLSLFNDGVDDPMVRNIFKKGFEQRIIVITNEQDQAKLYKLLEQGARGFCPSSISDELLMKVIIAVDNGEFWIGRKFVCYLMSKLILDRTGKNGDTPDKTLNNSNLTPRETEIANCISQGKCDKIIARDLDISPNTVKNHLCNIFKKLQINDRFQLALIYHGIRLN